MNGAKSLVQTLLTAEDGKAHSPRATVTTEVVSFEESFKQELIHFHECVAGGRTPTTSARDALHDIALCEAVLAVNRSREPRLRPSEPAMAPASSDRG